MNKKIGVNALFEKCDSEMEWWGTVHVEREADEEQ